MRRPNFLLGFAAAALTSTSRAVGSASSARKRVLWLRRQSYNEEVLAPFSLDGQTLYEPGYREICWLMRDHSVPFSQGYVRFDFGAITALWDVQQAFAARGISAPLTITSGYRAPETNEAVEGAAHNSQHLYAKAVDMYVDRVSMRELFDVCRSREVSGGIGYYGDHIHLDSGPRRSWIGER